MLGAKLISAFRHLGTARTGAYFSLAPFIGALIVLSLGDPLTLKLAIAGAADGAGALATLNGMSTNIFMKRSRTSTGVSTIITSTTTTDQ